MLRLRISNQTERLAAALAVDVTNARRQGDPLTPIAIVVPNAGVEAFLRLELARRTGLAANLELSLLKRFAAMALTAVNPGVRLIDGAALTGWLLSLFLDEHYLAAPELAPVRSYIEAVERADARDVRRCQLATKLGHIFEEYTFSRPQLLSDWSQGRLPLEGSVAAWQCRLWREMLGEEGLARRPGQGGRWMTLPELVEAGLPLAAPFPVFLFGFSTISRVFHRVIERLAAAGEVRCYSLAPGDLSVGLVHGAAAGAAQPLTAWARPGWENLRALSSMADGVEADFVDPTAVGHSTLRRLQRDLQHGLPDELGDEESSCAGGASLRLLSCAGVRREAEVVANEIWTLLEEDEREADRSRPPLRLSDIAVLVAGRDREAYFAHLDAAFRECHDLPRQKITPVAGSGSMAEAVERILDLPLSGFTRQDVLPLLVQSRLMERFSDVDARAWVMLCERLGILRGADRAGLAVGDLEDDLLTWDQGLRRLSLGLFMAGEREGERRVFRLEDARYLPEDSGDRASAVAFLALVRSLIADARNVAAARLAWSEWVGVVHALLTTYLVAADEEEEDERSACLQAIGEGLESMARLETGREIPYRVVRELARGWLRTASPGRRAGSGVVIAPLDAVRLLPFRIAFVLGLGEGEFPVSDARDLLDLRRSERREGDVMEREDDLLAFFERILSTKDRLYFTYVSRDPLTGDALAPSPVVQQLEHTVIRRYGAAAWHQERHPLHRHDGRYFDESTGEGSTRLRSHSPAAAREAAALRLRRELEKLLAAESRAADQGRRLASPSLVLLDRKRLERELAPEAWGCLARWLRLERLPVATVVGDTAVTLSRRALQRFLECPLQGWAAQVLHLDSAAADDEDAALARQDELLASDPRTRARLLRDSWAEATRQRRPLEQEYADQVWRAAARAIGPVGLFAAVERTAHLAQLHGWDRQVSRLLGAGGSVEWLRFGPAREERAAVGERVLDPVGLDLEFTSAAATGNMARVKVALTGRVTPITSAGFVILRMREVAKEESEEEQRYALLPAFIDSLLLSAAGQSEPRAAYLCYAGDAAEWRVSPTSQTEARIYLEELLRALLFGTHGYLLPCEAVFQWWRRGGSIGTAIAALCDHERATFSSRRGPLRRPERFAPLPEREAQAVAERRLGLFRSKFTPVEARRRRGGQA